MLCIPGSKVYLVASIRHFFQQDDFDLVSACQCMSAMYFVNVFDCLKNQHLSNRWAPNGPNLFPPDLLAKT